MANKESIFSLSVNGRFSFQPGRKGVAGTMPNLMVQMNDTSKAATLVISGYISSTKKFGLPLAIQSGLLALYDMENDTKVPVPSIDNEPGELIVKAGARPQWFDLAIDGQGEFWKQVLTPGHNYEVRWQDGPNAPWAYRGEKPQDPTHRLPIHHFSSTIKLAVFDDASTPPQFSISLAPTANVCHLSGEPRFGFRLQIMSHEDDVLTVCLNKTPLKELHGLEEIAHTTDADDDEVEWPYAIGCWGETEPFPVDNLFEEFAPGVPYDRTFWLNKYDEKTANGGELDMLDAGQAYTVTVSKALTASFTMWMRGSKGTLLAGSAKEREERWRASSGPVLLHVSDPFTFETK